MSAHLCHGLRLSDVSKVSNQIAWLTEVSDQIAWLRFMSLCWGRLPAYSIWPSHCCTECSKSRKIEHVPEHWQHCQKMETVHIHKFQIGSRCERDRRKRDVTPCCRIPMISLCLGFSNHGNSCISTAKCLHREIFGAALERILDYLL